ncbi:hypothetical protein PIB30_051132 [Stylosanthes scabra]|uniref:Isopenicillin N synthase-like Fe(2+) 2OG dioxygenase domain-containing protein n=1 Tax=Stylosanthes scabra TaxID=79078 RepID=A0ABU6YIG0_9FABA|nr:hypothetical protein [Stylosanthes scabra]
MNGMSAKMLELHYMVMNMIREAYDLSKHYTSDIEDMLMKGPVNFGLMKYKAPSNEYNKDGENGLVAHTDKNTLIILAQNDVEGSRNNKQKIESSKRHQLFYTDSTTPLWSTSSSTINKVVCTIIEMITNINPLELYSLYPRKQLPNSSHHELGLPSANPTWAWSNGRLHAAKHRVTMKGEKTRYSFALFTMPMDESKNEVPPELVDGNTHPLRYKPFTYGDFIKYFLSTLDNENALGVVAGL